MDDSTKEKADHLDQIWQTLEESIMDNHTHTHTNTHTQEKHHRLDKKGDPETEIFVKERAD
jgi:hypothetical protein